MKSLVISGGGVKGSYAVGVLKKWILDDGNDYEIMCGISVGAINTACLAQAPLGQANESFNKLLGFWNKVDNKQIKKDWFLFGKVASLWKPSVFNTQPLMDLIRKELDQKAVANSGRRLRVGSVSWNTGEYVVGTEQDPNLADYVLASSSFPVFMTPIKVGDHLLTDGGVRNITPIGDAIRLGSTDIDVIMCSNPDLPENWGTDKKKAIPDFLFRTLGLMSDEVARNDLQVCGLKNDLAELGAPYKKINIRLIMPKQSLPGDSLDFNQENIQKMIEIGYKQACEESQV